MYVVKNKSNNSYLVGSGSKYVDPFNIQFARLCPTINSAKQCMKAWGPEPIYEKTNTWRRIGWTEYEPVIVKVSVSIKEEEEVVA